MENKALLNSLKNQFFLSFSIGQLRHIMYHIGHCEAIFREHCIKTDDYLDYFGDKCVI